MDRLMSRIQGATLALIVLLCTRPGLSQQVDPAPDPATTPGADQDLLSGAPELTAGVELDPSALQHILVLLSGYEYFPTADDLRQVAPDPVPYLLTIVYDARHEWVPSYHHRAMDALGYFSTPQVQDHLTYLLHCEHTPDLLRHHVMTALARGFGEQATEEIQPFLSSEDIQLRLTAISALSIIPTPRSVEILQSAFEREPNEIVRQRIEEVLAARLGDEAPRSY